MSRLFLRALILTAPLGLAPSAAHAVDLDLLVESWTLTATGAGGQTGHDEAADVTLTSWGQVVVAGWLDGAAGHQDDAYVVGWEPDSTLAWDYTLDGGPLGPTRASSVDRFYAVSTEAILDDIALCGRLSEETGPEPTGRFYTEVRTQNPGGITYPPDFLWDFDYIDGTGSVDQDCFGVAWGGGTVYAAGWGDSGAEEGRWLTWRLDESDGAALPPLTYDFGTFEAVPDQAYDVALDTVTGNYAVVGTRGFGGAIGSPLNDTDWYVRMYDATGALLWEDVYAGSDDLDDRAWSAVVDTATGDVYVAGWTNRGLNNTDQANLDWLIRRYDGAGDGAGGAIVEWEQTFESAAQASEGATAITFDDLGDVLVGGWSIDPASGTEQWRVAKLASYDGVQLQEWLGAVQPGDSRIAGLDWHNGRLAMAGYLDNGTDRDFAATMLEGDGDGDGVGDSVDACPDDFDKSEDEGICGCGNVDDDSDGDGTVNCEEECPTDPDKLEPGVCGCDEPDTDSDGDGTADCIDDCPDDPDKLEWGICGCGAPDTDTDGDGVLGCDDACAGTPEGEAVDEFGCSDSQKEPVDDTGDTGAIGTTDDDGKGGCGCVTADPTGVSGILAVAAIAGLRRRRRVMTPFGRRNL